MKNITVLRQYLWLIHLSVITALVYLGSDILFTYLRTRLEVPPSSFVSRSKTEIADNHKKFFKYYSVIQDRNIFNSSPIKETGENEKEEIEIIPDDFADIEITDLRLKLLGTVLWSPEKSRAVIEDLNTKKQDIYKIGDVIEGAEIIDIMRNKVLLNNRGRIETLLAFENSDDIDKRSDVYRNAGRRGHSSIRNVGRNRWSVSRKDIDDTLSNMNNFMTQAMLRPYFENGRPSGFRIDRIKGNSMLEKIGLKNGDVIKSVNGLNVDSPEKAFEVYRQLKNEPQIKLQIKRRGRIEEFVYTIN